jgi:hypothetical protein
MLNMDARAPHSLITLFTQLRLMSSHEHPELRVDHCAPAAVVTTQVENFINRRIATDVVEPVLKINLFALKATGEINLPRAFKDLPNRGCWVIVEGDQATLNELPWVKDWITLRRDEYQNFIVYAFQGA